MTLLMPPHATPREINSIEAAKAARMELERTESFFAAYPNRSEHEETLAGLRAEIAKLDRFIESK